MPRRADDPVPSLAMVAAGGVGVLVVVAFVAILALASQPAPAGPGERVAVGRAAGSDLPVVVVPRCRDDRITAVEVAAPEGEVLWRIRSRKGSIDERYEVAADPVPLGFEVEVPLAGPLPEDVPLTARVVIDGDGEPGSDQVGFVLAELPAVGVRTSGGDLDDESFQRRALSAAACPESLPRLGVTTVVFGAAALGVVATYGVMVARWWAGRRP